MYDIGDIILKGMGGEGQVPCDGSLYSDAAYPEAAGVLAEVFGTEYSFTQTAVSGTPPLPGAAWYSAFSSDGKYLAIAHEESPYLTVLNTSDWSVVDGTPILPGFGLSVDFSPDGKYLAVSHKDGSYLTILHTEDWSPVAGAPTFTSSIYGLSFSPEGDQLVVSLYYSPNYSIINTSDWSTVTGLPNLGSVRNVSYSPDGKYLALGSGGITGKISVLLTDDWSVVEGVPSVPNGDNRLSFSPDGLYLAVAHRDSPYLTVMTVSDWSVVNTPTLDATAESVAFTPEGKYLVVGCRVSPYLVVIETTQWSKSAGMTGVPNITEGLSISPDGAFVAAAHNGQPVFMSPSEPPFLDIIPVKAQSPEGYFYVPDVPEQTPFVKPHIKIEE